MRKILVFMLLLLMATGVAFAEDGAGAEPVTVPEGEPDVVMMDQDVTEPEAGVMESEQKVTLMGQSVTESIDLSAVQLKLAKTQYEATGSAIKPVPVLMYEEAELTDLTPGVDYELVYGNNIKPGEATVTAVALEGEGVKCTGRTNPAAFQITAISLSKAKIELGEEKYSKTGSQIKPVPTLKYNGKTLTKGTDYTVSYKNNVNIGTATVTATAVRGSNYTGNKSVTFQIIPKKPATAKITSVKCNKPYVKVTWKKVTCTGYQLQTSRKSNFANPVTYKLKTNSKNVIKMKNKLTYYIRVRAYNTEGGKTTYGSWSSTSKKVYTTGPVGNKYSKNGAYVKDKTIKYDGNYYYYNSAGLKSGCSEKMWDKVKNNKSKTKYLIAVDCTRNRTCIFQGKKGNWKLKYYWKCTTGKKSTPTIKGNFKVCGKVSHFGESNGYSVWHATRIKYEYYFHSVLYKPWSKKTIIAGKLGKNLSHGCVRLKKSNAKWIYKNCKSGTRIVIY